MPLADDKAFWSTYEAEGPEAACTQLFEQSVDGGYLQARENLVGVRWEHESPWGTMIISVNDAKPEKDPRDIERAAREDLSGSNGGECVFCEGDPASRRHLRMPLVLGGKPWLFHFSPYVYFGQHCIVATRAHEPMRIDARTIEELLELCDMFPQYFFGSNADLPIVGGSILGHHHYQGGKLSSPLEKAPIERSVTVEGHPDVRAGFVRWSLNVLRLESGNRGELVKAASSIIEAWRSLEIPDAGVVAREADGTQHSTIAPIAKKMGDVYRLDLVLRNNVTSPEHPLGVFHPHEEVHAVKKENIGLVEAMGLAILPPRVKVTFDIAEDGAPDRKLVGDLFSLGLEHCRVLQDPMVAAPALGLR